MIQRMTEGHGGSNRTALRGFMSMGATAYKAGKKPADCTLSEGSRARAAWMQGYHEARRDAEGETNVDR
jgi:hypothetical protein